MFTSARALLFGYFGILIAVSSVLLALPAAWQDSGSVSALNAVFTATSAACVTGLITVNTANFTVFGQLVILFTIQFGGLGIILFSTIFVIQPAVRMSLRNRSLIREYYVDQVDFDPGRIVRAIVAVTFTLEAIGAVVLYIGFARLGVEEPGFHAIFHAVSAFANAGFSRFADSLEGFVYNESITVPVMVLTVLGGLGFVVLDDLMRKGRNRFAMIRRTLRARLSSGETTSRLIHPSARSGPERSRGATHRLTLHTRIVLSVTAVLLVGAALAYFALERGAAYGDMTTLEAMSASIFQSVTPRTAGFNTVPQGALGYPARTFTLALMFVGGAPGSIAGGIKVTTFALVFLAAVFGTNPQGEVEVGKRRIPAELVAKAHGLLFKAFGLLFLALLALTITERTLLSGDFGYADIVFEAFSAFGTVGLSTGVTSELSSGGRVVIIVTMFAGRLGLIALAMPRAVTARKLVRYPTGEIMIG